MFIVGEEKSVPGFKGQAGSQLETNATGDFKLKPVLILKMLGSLKITLNLLCLCSVNGATKPGWQHICLQDGLLNILSPLLSCCLEKGSQVSLLIDLVSAPCNACSHQHPFCILTHRSWSHFDFQVLLLRNTFCKALAAIDTDSSKGSGQS